VKLQQNRRKKRTPSPISCAGLRIFFRKMGKKIGRFWHRDTAFLRIASCVNHIGKTLARIRIEALDFGGQMRLLMPVFAMRVAISVVVSVVVLRKKFGVHKRACVLFYVLFLLPPHRLHQQYRCALRKRKANNFTHIRTKNVHRDVGRITMRRM